MFERKFSTGTMEEVLGCRRDRGRPCRRRAAEQRYNFAPFPLTEMHPIPHGFRPTASASAIAARAQQPPMPTIGFLSTYS
jgi:hypothetical protein